MIESTFCITKAFFLASKSNFPDREQTTNNNKHYNLCVFFNAIPPAEICRVRNTYISAWTTSNKKPTNHPYSQLADPPTYQPTDTATRKLVQLYTM